MKNFLSLLLIPLLLSSCGLGVSGNGNVEEQNRKVEAFDRIEAGGMFELHLVQSETHRLKVVADENLIDLIETYVDGGVLHIRSKENIREAKELDIYIAVPELEKIELSGAVEIDGKGVFASKDLRIESSGAAQIDLEIKVEDLELELSGATEIELRGSAENVRIEASGASEIELFELKVRNMRVDLSGASELEINVSDDLQIEASGASDIKYRGGARISRQNLSGAASVSNQ